MVRDPRRDGPVSGASRPGVAGRLSILRELYVPESIAEAPARLAAERPSPKESFEGAVARRLCDLRALSDLARHLHRAQRTRSSGEKGDGRIGG
ncbi:MAG TPA: hypothetical protein VJT73_05290 [Polyangiaceae bacterium]|nr:hypothetical protein [Polyangiaceae bacterium]